MLTATVLYKPVLEEFVFRGLFPAVIYNRCRSTKVRSHLRFRRPCVFASMIESSVQPLLANAVFSMLHLINMVGGPPTELIALQCTAAFALGLYYSTRHTRGGGSLWECILLHSTNNLLSVIYEVGGEQVDWATLGLGVCCTVLWYLIAAAYETRVYVAPEHALTAKTQ